MVLKLVLGNFIAIGLDYYQVSNTLRSTTSGLIVHLRQLFKLKTWNVRKYFYSDSIDKNVVSFI